MIPEPNSPPKFSILASLRKLGWVVAAKWWGVRSFLQKKNFLLQDRLGLSRYGVWIRTVEVQQVRQFLKMKSDSLFPIPTICFCVIIEWEGQQVVRDTIDNLQHIYPGAPITFLLLNDSKIEQENWLQSMVEKPGCPVLSILASGRPWEWVPPASELPGDWIIPIRAGDRLSPTWLAFFRSVIGEDPETELVYWDEDEIDFSGRRSHPFFKPDWSPELLFSVNYLRAAAFRKSLFARFDQLPRSKKESGIFWLAHKAEKVIHIPFVLQHCLPGTPDAKGHAQLLHAACGKSFLISNGLQDVEANIRNGDLRYTWKSEFPDVSIIIPTRNNYYYLQRCLSSLIDRTRYPGYEILIMDDHSTEREVLEYYQDIQDSHPNIRVYKNQEAFNYSRVNNHGARLSSGDLLLFLNNDVEILDGGWLKELVRWCLLPGVGMVGAKLLYPDKTIQHAGIVMGMTGHAAHLYASGQTRQASLYLSDEWYRNVSAVTGACMLVRRDVFERIGGFNEDFYLVFNDVEIGQRALQAGYRIVYSPAACLIHYEGRSRAKYIPPQDVRLGARLLRPTVESGDPYYTPNLSLAVNWPSFKRKGEPPAITRLDNIVQYKG